MKFVTGFIISAFLATFATFSVAQEAVKPKNGDSLGMIFIQYEAKGRDVAEKMNVKYKATLGLSGEGYTVTSVQSGRVVVHDKNFTVTSITPNTGAAPAAVPENQRFAWMPKDFSAGKKEGQSFSGVGNCGTIAIDLPDVVLKEGEKVISFTGANRTVKTVEVTFKGTWSASCGKGLVERLVIFSQDLGLILEQKEMSFDQAGFLYSGRTTILSSIN